MTTINPGTRDLLEALRTRFAELDYTVDGVIARIGESGQAGLGRNQTTPADRALAGADDPLATLIRIFILQQPVLAADLERSLPGWIEQLIRAEVIGPVGAGKERSRRDSSGTDHVGDGGSGEESSDHGSSGPGAPGTGDDAGPTSDGTTVPSFRALIDIRPYATEDATPKWIVSDLTPGLDSPPPPMNRRYVLGVSPASTTLAQLTIRNPVGTALDLGTGCGVQSMHLADHVEQIVATDLNPRALELAAFTAALNETEVDLRAGDLYAAVGEQTFDLIVTNPPYVMSPPSEDALTYRESTRSGDGLVREVVVGGIDRLNQGGILQVLGNWAIHEGMDWRDRLRSWFPETGVQALVLQREQLDVFEYIEIWLTDAGLVGSHDYLSQYTRWLDYFASLGITGVGMGWITVRRAGDQPSVIRTEAWAHAVAQPVGDALGDWLQATELAALPTDELFARTWRLDRQIDAETLGRPGAEDPEHVIFRQRTGLLRATEVDTALGGVLGACDGDLALGPIVDAVAQLLEIDAQSLRDDLEIRLRELIADGFLHTARA